MSSSLYAPRSVLKRTRRLWAGGPLYRPITTNVNKLASSYLPPSLLSNCERQDESTWSPKSLDEVEETYLLPPPNVTGKLHMGHALTVTIQDANVRYKRLCGKQVRWVYGLDHAGIATQTVVEKTLAKTERKTKDSLGRELFVKKVWDWTNDHKQKIQHQLRILGASLDYNREYFTLDNGHSSAVKEAFIQLHQKGLLKRARRMVNWCPQLRTALSDLEVDHTQLTGPTEISFLNGEKAIFGVADDFAYKVDGSTTNEEIVVRTTRLETMLGDVAVAVHPDDSRFKHLIGQSVTHPFVTGRRLPIVGDRILVDPALGTGAVKITPAHDPLDFDCATRLHLPVGESLFTESGIMDGKQCGPLTAGLSRFQAREKLRTELSQLGLYRGQTNHPLALGRCSRTGDIIEPILKWQWFVDGRSTASVAQSAVRDQKMSFFPPEQQNIWNMWLEKNQDWCISRQLWWGHRIPAYRVVGTGESNWVVAQDEHDARRLLNANADTVIEQDEDVLDTWFSSALLPITVFGWPQKSPIKQQLAWMETGSDILFFWVARMVMMCTVLNEGLLPFPKVYLHSMVRDRRGRKMSKSLGNVIDPLDVIGGVSLKEMIQALNAGNLDRSEVSRATADLKDQFGKTNGIPAYGADSLRLALASYPQTVPQVLFDLERVAQARLFCNKLWQATRFTLARLEPSSAISMSNRMASEITIANNVHIRWIRHRLGECLSECTTAYEMLDVESAFSAIKQFFWNDFCDVFLECTKLEIDPVHEPSALADCLKAILVMLHPIAPDVTLELWSHLTRSDDDIMKWQDLKACSTTDLSAKRDMDICMDISRAIRALKVRFGNNVKHLRVSFSSEIPNKEILDLARRLAKVDTLVMEATVASESGDQTLLEPFQVVPGVVRLDQAADAKVFNNLALVERDRIIKRQMVLQKAIDAEGGRLASSEFMAKAPQSVKDKTFERLKNLETEFQALQLAKENLTSSTK